jgi:hypothetical protein
LIRGRGNIFLREASPLFDSPSAIFSLKGEGENSLKEASPLLPLFLRVELRKVLD